MTLFKSQTAQKVWIEENCETCFQPEEVARRLHGKDTCCPIQERALTPGRKTLPKEWQATRSDEMAKSIKCNAYQAKPAVLRRPASTESPDSMFGDDTPYRVDVDFVPVEGWPSRPKKDKGSDHA